MGSDWPLGWQVLLPVTNGVAAWDDCPEVHDRDGCFWMVIDKPPGGIGVVVVAPRSDIPMRYTVMRMRDYQVIYTTSFHNPNGLRRIYVRYPAREFPIYIEVTRDRR